MKIGILNADAVKPEFAEEFGEYPDMFAEVLLAVDPGLDLVTYEVVQDEYPAHLDEVGAYIITGSKLGVYDELPWVLRLKEFVVDCTSRRRLLVSASGTRWLPKLWVARPLLRMWVGASASRIFPTADAASMACPEGPINLRANHKDRSHSCHRVGKCWPAPKPAPLHRWDWGNIFLTFQAHPEFSEGYARALLTMRRGIFGEELYRAPWIHWKSRDNLQVARHILDFISRNQQVKQS